MCQIRDDEIKFISNARKLRASTRERERKREGEREREQEKERINLISDAKNAIHQVPRCTMRLHTDIHDNKQQLQQYSIAFSQHIARVEYKILMSAKQCMAISPLIVTHPIIRSR